MKFIAFAVLSLFFIAACAHSPTSSNSNIAGLWKGEFNNPMGGPPNRLAYNFIQDGKRIVGAMRNETMQGEWENLEDFKVKGNWIYFTISPKISGGKITFKYRGKIEGDKIKMTYKAKDPVKMDRPDSASIAMEKVRSRGMYDNAGRYGVNDIGVNIDRADYIDAFTLTRVQ